MILRGTGSFLGSFGLFPQLAGTCLRHRHRRFRRCQLGLRVREFALRRGEQGVERRDLGPGRLGTLLRLGERLLELLDPALRLGELRRIGAHVGVGCRGLRSP
jgi:hypothetical protein